MVVWKTICLSATCSKDGCIIIKSRHICTKLISQSIYSHICLRINGHVFIVFRYQKGDYRHIRIFLVVSQLRKLWNCFKNCPCKRRQKKTNPCTRAWRLNAFLILWRHQNTCGSCEKVNSAAATFKPIILKVGVPHEFVQDDSGNYETLRKARVHLDAAAMVVFRHFWRTLTLSSLWISIMVDASPQGLGTELYAASFDIMFMGDHTSFQRRLFPQIHIGRNMYTLIGKAHALMHLIFLQVGPYYAGLRSFCDHVGTITTDQGTEKSIVDFRDILIPFCQSMNVRIPSWAKPQSHLFSSALPTVGWMFPPFVSPPTRNPANDWPATFVVSQFVVHSLMATYLNIFQNAHRHHWTYWLSAPPSIMLYLQLS